MHLRVRTIIELANLSHVEGLRVAVQFFTGSGLDMPFADECFDVVWTQNTSMNIPDKARLVAEQRRVVCAPVDAWYFKRSSPVRAVTSRAGCLGRVIQPPASWFQPSRRQLLREAGFEERAWVSFGASGDRDGAWPFRRAAVPGPDAVEMQAAWRCNQAQQRVIKAHNNPVPGGRISSADSDQAIVDAVAGVVAESRGVNRAQIDDAVASLEVEFTDEKAKRLERPYTPRYDFQG